MPVSAADFRQALGHFASGVTVVTTTDGQQTGGLTVSAFSSVSLNPPYILVCIDKNSSSIPLIRAGKVFNVNVLGSDQVDISNRFASSSDDKLSGIPYHLGKLGAPVLEKTLATLECSLAQELDGGDHVIFLGLVEHSRVDESKSPLLYYHGKYSTLAE